MGIVRMQYHAHHFVRMTWALGIVYVCVCVCVCTFMCLVMGLSVSVFMYCVYAGDSTYIHLYPGVGANYGWIKGKVC